MIARNDRYELVHAWARSQCPPIDAFAAPVGCGSRDLSCAAQHSLTRLRRTQVWLAHVQEYRVPLSGRSLHALLALSGDASCVRRRTAPQMDPHEAARAVSGAYWRAAARAPSETPPPSASSSLSTMRPAAARLAAVGAGAGARAAAAAGAGAAALELGFAAAGAAALAEEEEEEGAASGLRSFRSSFGSFSRFSALIGFSAFTALEDDDDEEEEAAAGAAVPPAAERPNCLSALSASNESTVRNSSRSARASGAPSPSASISASRCFVRAVRHISFRVALDSVTR